MLGFRYPLRSPMQNDAPKGNVALTSLPVAALYRMQVREMRNYAMFMIDPQGTLISWNAGVEHLLGYSEQETMAKRLPVERHTTWYTEP